MKIDRHKKRLKSIKSRYMFFPRKCGICHEEYVRERMWQFYRYGVNHRIVECYYCQHCVSTAEDALKNIEADRIPLVESPTLF